MASFSPDGSPGPMQVPPAPTAWLDVRGAVSDGWQAFRRAPWVFIGFTLLFSVLGTILLLIRNNLTEAGLTPLTGLIALLCQLASSLAGLWGAVGTVRGAMVALAGRRPRFSDLARVDIRAIVRLMLANLLLSLLLAVVLLPLLIASLIGMDQMFDFDFPLSGEPILRSFTPTPAPLALAILPLLAAVALSVYITVNQHFVVQLASLGRRSPWRTLAEGRAVVDRQWPSVFVLILLESLLLLAGLLALLVGFFAAFPLVACVSTAAYRQLFPEPEGRAGLPAA